MKRDIAAVAGLLILSGCGMERIEVRPAGADLSLASPAERAYQEGKADLAAGRPGLAIVAFETALANDPGSAKVLNGLGAAYDGLHRYDVAQSFYRQALQREPNSPDVLNNMAISLQMAGKPEAMQWFAKAERLDPKNPVIDANVNLAQATPAPTAVATMMASQEDPGAVPLDRPRIERASPLVYEVELPKDHPTDLGQMVRPESPRSVASVQRKISVPPVFDISGPAPPIHNVIIPTPPVDDTANPTPLGRDTAGPARPTAPVPPVGNITSQLTPPAPQAPTASFVAQPVPANSVQATPTARPTVTVFDPTLLACAPNVAPATLNAIIQVESGGNPLALHVNGTDQQPPPARDPAEAARVAETYVGLGYSVDVGLMQVNTRNLAATGHSIQQALDPCTNILHGSTILSADYAKAARTRGDDPYALLTALSAYNTGDFHRGFDNGYVAQVLSSNQSAGPRRHHAADPTIQHAAAAEPRKPVVQSERMHALKHELDRLEQTPGHSNATKLVASGPM